MCVNTGIPLRRVPAQPRAAAGQTSFAAPLPFGVLVTGSGQSAAEIRRHPMAEDAEPGQPAHRTGQSERRPTKGPRN
jgi:hypothetical protein